MSRWLACMATAPLLLAAPPGAAAAAGPLQRYAPVVVHDRGERDPLTSVHAFAGRVPGVPARRERPVLYGRRAGPWLQYWMLFAADTQDHGLLRTGRHEGDWELVALRLRDGRPVEAVYGQHAGAESCGIRDVRRTRSAPPSPTGGGGRPVVFAARGSHAAYFVPGLRDRTWPDPNDEADGRGRRARPRLVRVSAGSPPWMRHRGRWGATRAGWVPGEADSPRGPAFHRAWSDPEGWAAAASQCTRGDCDRRGECDGAETARAALLAGLGLLGAFGLGGRRLRRVPT